MADAENATPQSPQQPERVEYLAAVSALLMAAATGSCITDAECDALLDAMPDTATRAGLSVWLDEVMLRDPWSGSR
jgi:hypothetical protein